METYEGIYENGVIRLIGAVALSEAMRVAMAPQVRFFEKPPAAVTILA